MRMVTHYCTWSLLLAFVLAAGLLSGLTADALAQSLPLRHENLPPAGTEYEPAPLKRGSNAIPAADAAINPTRAAARGKSSAGGRSAAREDGLLKIDKRFEGFGFLDNAEETGFIFIPPDPIGAAGKNLLVAVVNSMIEARSKGGTLLWRDGLPDFFAPLEPGFIPFDPKVVYDHYEDRFVVVALDYTDEFFGDPESTSRILLAVSKSHNPRTPTAADWHFHAIDAAFSDDNFFLPGIFDYWADYPGLELDEEAVYITANTFSFVTDVPGIGLVQVPGGTRLWIVDKGATGGFYNGGPAQVGFFDPYGDLTELRDAGLNLVTTMPAEVHGAGGIGPGIGTFLVSYSGLTFGPGLPEAIQVIRVDDPLGSAGGPFFIHEFLVVGDIEEPFQLLPDAPQDGTVVRIEVNDRRALDAVWRNDALWFTTTIAPKAGPDAGETTAHWFHLNTSSVPGGPLSLADQGNISGDDIAPSTFTFYPAVAVNRNDEVGFGFSASAETIFPGAFAAARRPGDPEGTVSRSLTVHPGEDYYIRMLGFSRNRWGDYSGISVDPTNDEFFWVFNEYAGERGTVLPSLPNEDGRWETAWARLKVLGGRGQHAIAEVAGTYAPALEALPSTYALAQNYPNPFNPSTEITFELPEAVHARLVIYDATGREVARLADGPLSEGRHHVTWRADAVPSGVYFYSLTAGSFSQVRSMILLK